MWAMLSGCPLKRCMGRVPEPGATRERNGGANFWCLCQGVRWAASGEAPSLVAGVESSAAGS